MGAPPVLAPPPVKLALIGAGEHALVVVEAARSRPDLWEPWGFLDPAPDERAAARLGMRWLGNDEQGQRLAASEDLRFILAVGPGNRDRRRELVQRYKAAGARFATVVHAAAQVSPSAELGAGVLVGCGAIVNGGAHVEAHCLINTGAIVEHDVALGRLCTVGPGAIIGGGAVIEAETVLGLGCRIRDHIRVSHGAVIGMGAVLVANAPPGSVMLGVPARAREGKEC